MPLRHGVIAARVEGVATQNPPNRHQAALDDAVFVNRFIAVVRACGVKAASVCRQGFCKRSLIEFDEQQKGDARQIPRCARQGAERWRLGVRRPERKIQFARVKLVFGGMGVHHQNFAGANRRGAKACERRFLFRQTRLAPLACGQSRPNRSLGEGKATGGA